MGKENGKEMRTVKVTYTKRKLNEEMKTRNRTKYFLFLAM